MPSTSTMTIRLSKETQTKLAKLARATDRTKAYLATKAIEEYIAAQEWQIQAIQEAVTEADSDDAVFHDHADVVARMKKKIASAKRGARR